MIVSADEIRAAGPIDHDGFLASATGLALLTATFLVAGVGLVMLGRVGADLILDGLQSFTSRAIWSGLGGGDAA